MALGRIDAHRDGDCVDPSKGPGNTSGDGQRHEAVNHATHRHFHGGGDNSGEAQTVDMGRLGRPGSLRPVKGPSSG